MKIFVVHYRDPLSNKIVHSACRLERIAKEKTAEILDKGYSAYYRNVELEDNRDACTKGLCDICFGDVLGKINDLENQEKRFFELSDFINELLGHDIEEARKVTLINLRVKIDSLLKNSKSENSYVLAALITHIEEEIKK